jgi:hypothetical protein
MVCRGKIVTIYSLNGELILEQNVCEGSGDREDYVASCAWYEGCGNEWLENELLFTGQRGGVVNVWRKAISTNSSPSSHRNSRSSGSGRPNPSPWKLELVKRLDHSDKVNAIGSLGVPGSSGAGRQRSRSRGRSVSGNGGGNGGNGRDEAAITCIAPMAQVVYTGDEEGRVVSFNPFFSSL